MKKIRILILRADFDKFIRELILFGCVDIEASDDLPEYSELDSLAERESVDLECYETSKERITVLGTDYTILLTGWIPVKSVQNLLTILSGYVHAWDIRDPSPDELDRVPAAIWPKFLTKLRKGARPTFSPLIFKERIENSD